MKKINIYTKMNEEEEDILRERFKDKDAPNTKEVIQYCKEKYFRTRSSIARHIGASLPRIVMWETRNIPVPAQYALRICESSCWEIKPWEVNPIVYPRSEGLKRCYSNLKEFDKK